MSRLHSHPVFSLSILPEDGAVAGQMPVPLQRPEAVEAAAGDGKAPGVQHLLDVEVLHDLLQRGLSVPRQAGCRRLAEINTAGEAENDVLFFPPG